MNPPDDLQKLWQERTPDSQEDKEMWKQLVLEKRTSFDELLQAENRAEYVVALILGPLLTLAATKAQDPAVQLGYGLLGLTVLALAAITWLSQRSDENHDLSVREHLEALLARYDGRIRFLSNGTVFAGIPLSMGVLVIFLGRPGAVAQPLSWLAGASLIALYWGASWLALHGRKARLTARREQTRRMLQSLIE